MGLAFELCQTALLFFNRRPHMKNDLRLVGISSRHLINPADAGSIGNEIGEEPFAGQMEVSDVFVINRTFAAADNANRPAKRLTESIGRFGSKANLHEFALNLILEPLQFRRMRPFAVKGFNERTEISFHTVKHRKAFFL